MGCAAANIAPGVGRTLLLVTGVEHEQRMVDNWTYTNFINTRARQVPLKAMRREP